MCTKSEICFIFSLNDAEKYDAQRISASVSALRSILILMIEFFNIYTYNGNDIVKVHTELATAVVIGSCSIPITARARGAEQLAAELLGSVQVVGPQVLHEVVVPSDDPLVELAHTCELVFALAFGRVAISEQMPPCHLWGRQGACDCCQRQEAEETWNRNNFHMLRLRWIKSGVFVGLMKM